MDDDHGGNHVLDKIGLTTAAETYDYGACFNPAVAGGVKTSKYECTYAMMLTVILGGVLRRAVRVMIDKANMSETRKICSMICRRCKRRRVHGENAIELMEMSLDSSKHAKIIP